MNTTQTPSLGNSIASWKHWPLTIYFLFVVLLLILVFKAQSKGVDMVTPSYYQKELQYSSKMDAMKNVYSLSAAIDVQISKEAVTFKLPSECIGQSLNGNVVLYRASSVADDKSYPLNIDATGMQSIPASDLKMGNYSLQIDWTLNGKSYYFEQSLYVLQ